MKKILVIVCTLIMAFYIVACGSGQPVTTPEAGNENVETAAEEAVEALTEAENTVDGDFTIGFCGMTLNNEYHIILANAVKKAAEDAGIKCEIQAGSEHASVDEQLVIIENFINEGVDGIILVPASSQGLISALEDCKGAGIPVINLDTKLAQDTLDALGQDIPFYGTDNFVGGQQTGEFFAKKFPEDGTKVAILRGVQGQTNDDDRYNGFLDKAGKIDLVAEQHCDWETDKAYTAIQNILQANPDLRAIYCENDLMGLGAYQAVDEAGLADEVTIFSYDGVVAGLEAVVNGHFVSTCAQQPIEMGRLGVENMIKIFGGGQAEKYIDTGCKLVTDENAKEVLETTKQYTEEVSPTK